jgi:hypothetical protein
MAVFATAGRRIAVREQMPWNEADQERYNIVRERYTSDLSDEEYAQKEPLLPQPKWRGRKPTAARTNLNAIFYLARCTCPWRYGRHLQISPFPDSAEAALTRRVYSPQIGSSSA